MGRRKGRYGVSGSKQLDSLGDFSGVCSGMLSGLSADVRTVRFGLRDRGLCVEDFILRDCSACPDGAYRVSLVWGSAVLDDIDQAALQEISFRYDANIGDDSDDHSDDSGRSGRVADDALHGG